VPADVEGRIAGEIRDTAVKAFLELECHGLARVDFFVDESDAIYLNEINTMPGFTGISMYPKLWKAKHGDDKSLVTRLLGLALERKTKYSFVRKYEAGCRDE
jgi:D-alanine-D-alanine ligase